MRPAEAVHFVRLTSVGIRALEGVFEVTEKGWFEAWIKDQDERGIWVNPVGTEESVELRGKSVVLVKWEYVATIQTIEA